MVRGVSSLGVRWAQSPVIKMELAAPNESSLCLVLGNPRSRSTCRIGGRSGLGFRIKDCYVRL